MGESFADLKGDLEKMISGENPNSLIKLIKDIANKIHPDSTKMAHLTSALKNIKNVNEVLELSENLSDKLCNLEIDLYALIKEISEEKKFPPEMLMVTESILSQENNLL